MTDSGKPDPIRLGIIGVGQIGKHHVRTYQKISGAQIVAVADINEVEARRVAGEFNIPDVVTDFRALLARDDIQAVDVCLHNNLHMPVTVAALEAGKHVYCEKPMAGAYIDAERMLKAARDADRNLSIQLSTLYRDETRAAMALIQAGELGRLYHARSTGHRRRGRPYVDGYGTPSFVQKSHASGGALYDMGVYHIARMLYLLGNPDVLTITGKIYQETPMDSRRRAISGYDVEELGMGFVRLADNISLDIIESWAIHLDKFDGSVVVGSEGGLRLDPFGFFRNAGDVQLDATTDLDAFNWRIHNVYENGDVYDGPQEHWIAALQGRVALLPTAELALNTMLISEGIYLSDRLGREVTAEEVRAESVSTSVAV
jgi:predicted dehydrogenase